MPDLDSRVDLLERLQVQQSRLNDQLITITARLGEEHALYQERQLVQEVRQAEHAERARQHEERMVAHEAQMAELRQILAAIKDMLDRGNGH